MNEGFTLQGLLVLVSIVIGISTLLFNQRKMRRENEADAQAREDRLKAEITKHNDSVEGRLSSLEASTKLFMTRADIEGKIEHEKNNRATAQDGQQRQIERALDTCGDLKVEIARVSQRQDGFANDMAEIKMLLKEQTREIGNKIEKLQDTIRKEHV